MDEDYNLETPHLIPTSFAGEKLLIGRNSPATTVLRSALCILHSKAVPAFKRFLPIYSDFPHCIRFPLSSFLQARCTAQGSARYPQDMREQTSFQ